jgi:putative acetyltransferase
VIIRDVCAADHRVIAALVTAAFGRSDEAVIVDEARGGCLVELVAEDDGEIVGHALFSRMTCNPPALVAGLGPLAVAPDRQGRGVGDALVRRGLEACRILGVETLVVLGAPAYYGRFGFTVAPSTIGSRYAGLAAFQALPLISGALDRTIDIAYPAAFDS